MEAEIPQRVRARHKRSFQSVGDLRAENSSDEQFNEKLGAQAQSKPRVHTNLKPISVNRYLENALNTCISFFDSARFQLFQVFSLQPHFTCNSSSFDEDSSFPQRPAKVDSTSACFQVRKFILSSFV